MAQHQPGRAQAARVVCVIALLAVLLAGCQGSPPAAPRTASLRLAVAQSLETSGLLAATIPHFENEFGVTVDLKAVSRAEAFALGVAGEVDALWVNDPDGEQAFIAAGHGLERVPVMSSAFVLVGPLDDPAGVRGAGDIFEAFAMIADAEAPFVAIDDGAGAREQEAAIWAEAGLQPEGAWYQTGSDDLPAALRDIDARGGYSLWDRASFLALREHGSGLDILLEDYAALRTIYSVIAVNPAKHVGVNGPAAAHFVIWLTLEPTQFRIGTMTLDDKPAYFPEADAWQPTAAPD